MRLIHIPGQKTNSVPIYSSQLAHQGFGHQADPNHSTLYNAYIHYQLPLLVYGMIPKRFHRISGHIFHPGAAGCTAGLLGCYISTYGNPLFLDLAWRGHRGIIPYKYRLVSIHRNRLQKLKKQEGKRIAGMAGWKMFGGGKRDAVPWMRRKFYAEGS